MLMLEMIIIYRFTLYIVSFQQILQIVIQRLYCKYNRCQNDEKKNVVFSCGVFF